MDAGSEAYLSHKVLDAEHQGQIDLLLQVEKEFSGAANPARLALLLDRLIEFTDIHFMSEQVLMRERAYPGLPAHEEEHSQLIGTCAAFKGACGGGAEAHRRPCVRLARLGASPHPNQGCCLRSLSRQEHLRRLMFRLARGRDRSAPVLG